MSHIFHNPNRGKLPKSQHAIEEFSSEKGLILCNECKAAHFKKRWYRGIEKVKLSDKKDPPIKFTLCPACSMVKNKQYEGRITIKNLPAEYSERLEELVRGFGKRAYERDPMHRIIGLSSSGGSQIITTTENELANKLANKIKNAFSKI